MIGVMVTFAPEGGFDGAIVRKIADEAGGMFEGMPGLRSKVFTLDEDEKRARNFYIWDDEAAARSFFNDQLVERVTGLYGTAPKVEFVEVVRLVDNAH
jgi:heme-degrading monooxygenase HmoA